MENEYYRTLCGAAGIAITFADGSKHAINAYNAPTCTNACDGRGCVYNMAETADHVCGWEEAENLLSCYEQAE